MLRYIIFYVLYYISSIVEAAVYNTATLAQWAALQFPWIIMCCFSLSELDSNKQFLWLEAKQKQKQQKRHIKTSIHLLFLLSFEQNLKLNNFILVTFALVSCQEKSWRKTVTRHPQ